MQGIHHYNNSIGLTQGDHEKQLCSTSFKRYQQMTNLMQRKNYIRGIDHKIKAPYACFCDFSK